MGGFLGAVLEFPTVLFTFLLVVVIGYWLLALTGVLDLGDGADATAGLDTDAGAEPAGRGGAAGTLAGVGLGAVPPGVVGSLLVAVAWFVSLAGGVLLDALGFGPVARMATGFAVLVVALLGAWLVCRLVVMPLRRLFPAGSEDTRSAFVGRLCVIRTGRVTADFGQAEVTADDGSTAIVQVRQPGDETMRAGSMALIYDYEPLGEFFWVTLAGAAFDQPTPRTPT
ncbi:hypothetical protein [Plantactinospora sp. GCM10030261]|uniref:hypothetical protein n=1 Tax=Plantactinospora sp. GCM10030261 TaxID=3273420 RepID=UPI00360F5B61